MHRSLWVPASTPLMLRQTHVLSVPPSRREAPSKVSVLFLYTPLLYVNLCREHASSPQPCLVLSSHCNEEKAQAATQELLVETEDCSSISIGSVYGPVWQVLHYGTVCALEPLVSGDALLPSLECEHRIWEPFPLLFPSSLSVSFPP